MVHLGRRDSRMKDFHDIWALSESFPFDGGRLHDAVARCFERRETAWTAESPDALTTEFCTDSDLQSRWQTYLRAGAFRTHPPARFEEISKTVRSFLGPVRDRILSGGSLDEHWPAGGPWQLVATEKEK